MQNPQINTEIIASKLKRNGIHHELKSDKIIIGQAKKQYVEILFLGAFPIIAGLGFLGFLYIVNQKWEPFIIHLTVAALFLIETGIFNLQKARRKQFFNNKVKTFEKGKISIRSKKESITILPSDITRIQTYTQQTSKATFEGALIVVDKNSTPYKILGLQDENEKYLKNNLKTFHDFLIRHMGIIFQPKQ